MLLIDEPDAHLHMVLQSEAYALVREVARARGAQLLVATHSEVVLDSTAPERVIAVVGGHPRRLVQQHERDGLREAMKRLTTRDLLLATEKRAVLYTESLSDLMLLQAWARVLGHPARAFLEQPYHHSLSGRNPKEARDHFFALRAAHKTVRGLCILDRDTGGEDVAVQTGGLGIVQWERYEIENYLLVPDAIQRYWEQEHKQLTLEQAGQQPPLTVLRDEMPPAVFRDPLSEHLAMDETKGSEFLIETLRRCGDTTPKAELYRLAQVMRPEEIHEDVRRKLDLIAEALASPTTVSPVE